MTADSHVNAVSTQSSWRISSQGPLTRAAARAATASPRDVAAWTSRTLINPRQRRAVELHAAPDPVTAAEVPPATSRPPRRRSGGTLRPYKNSYNSVSQLSTTSATRSLRPSIARRRMPTTVGVVTWNDSTLETKSYYLPMGFSQRL
ncbi:hypothetical protein L917_21522 [Phytophthora nicotianae]|uniref:Uncharacterized protein n=1 Tax=Phytophthora nicotianae TaxID=4792 RepID=W2JXB3_PHYNI|nr:hypothetical protein L917_21522 [Phytophthora nicotianae]